MSQKTLLYEKHKENNARLIDFGGYMMPVQYKGIKQEHKAVRNQAGLFDVSHMGEFVISGARALDLLQKLTVNNAAKLVPGKAQYTAMCYEDGGIVDDLLVYQLNEDNYMLVVNAANIEKNWKWINKQNDFGTKLENRSDKISLLAIQGPKSTEILQQLTDTDLNKIGYYSFTVDRVAGQPEVIISATGYTGEKGFELYIDNKKSDPAIIWDQIAEAGEAHGLEFAGLGARDTLRLEMGLALYGNDITEDTHPLEARLGWLVKFDKGDFVGKKALLQKKEKGLTRRLTGIEIEESRKVPRAGYKIFNEEEQQIGFVTSGTQSISLGKGIGMGYIQLPYADEGSKVYIKIRKEFVPAVVVKPPFLNK